MRKIGLFIMFLSTLVLANELDEIDKIVSQINAKRVGKLPKDKIVSVSSPIPKLIVEHNESNESNITIVKPKEEEFKLTAIMNNRAFINGRWVKIGDKINGFKLVDIMDNSIFLRDGNRTKLVFFKSNKKIKITVGR